MVNVSAYPVQVDGRRLDDLAVGLETSSHTTGALRSADQPLVGVDGEVASLYDSREPGAFGLGMLVRGTDRDGFVPASSDGQATYRRNLDALRALLLRTDALLDVQRVMDKANSTLLATGGHTNLLLNPSNRVTGSLAEVRRNYLPDPAFVTASGWTGMGAGGVPSAQSTYSQNFTTTAGTEWTAVVEVTAPAGSSVDVQVSARPTTAAAFGTNAYSPTTVTVPAGQTRRIANTYTMPSGADGVRLYLLFTGTIQPGTVVSKGLLEIAGVDLGHMQGDTAAANGLTYSWTGAANNSASIAQGPAAGYGAPLNAYTASSGVVGWVNGNVYRLLLKRAVPSGTILAFQSTSGQAPIAIGDTRTGRVTIAQVGGTGPLLVAPRLLSYNGSGVFAENLAMTSGDQVSVPANGSVGALIASVLVPSSVTGTGRFILYARQNTPAGSMYDLSAFLLEGVNNPAAVAFDGNSAQSGWTGTPDQSASIQDSADLRASCKVVDAVTPEDSPGDYGRVAVVLKVVHAFWRSLIALTWGRTGVTSGSVYEVPSLEGSSAPINDAVVCLTGPASAGVQVVDDATGTFVRLNEALPAGSVWRVNAGTWESRVAAGLTVDSPDTAGVDKAGVTDQGGTHPRLLRLYPKDDGTGRRVVKVRATGGGFTTATSLAIKARRAHL